MKKLNFIISCLVLIIVIVGIVLGIVSCNEKNKLTFSPSSFKVSEKNNNYFE